MAIILLVALFFFKPEITGRVVGETVYSELSVNESFSKSGELNLSFPGNLTSLYVSGSYSGRNAEIYLDDLLVFSSRSESLELTGNVVGDISRELLNISTEENASDETNITEGNQTSHANTTKRLPEISFSNECEDTCVLDNYPSNVTLRIILDNATLNLSSITYTYLQTYEETVGLNLTENLTTELDATQNITTNASSFNVTRNITYEEFNHTAVKVGEPVTWSKTVEDVDTVTIPGSAYNIEAEGVTVKAGNGELSIDEFSKLKQGTKEDIELRINKDKAKITYQTPGPTKKEKLIGKYKKQVTISSDIHYTDILASTEIEESPKEAITVYWLKDDGKEKVHDVKYIDSNNNNLIDILEWIVPHLSNQTYEISITILNPYTYLRDGETWTVAFNTTGTANLTISSPNAGWTEFLTDNPDTFDEMEFLDIRCGEESLKGELMLVGFDNLTYDYADLSDDDSVDVEKLLVENYECNETGYLYNFMHKAGYATLLFEFSNQNMSVTDYAYDPIGTYNFVDVNRSTNDYYAYQKSGSANFTGPDDTGDGEATDGNYSNIASSDGNYWVTSGANETGQYDAQLYKFYISENESNVTDLNFKWEGYGETGTGYNTTLYAWDYDGSQWVQLDTIDFPLTSTDQNLTHSETSNPGKFINDTDGEVVMMAKTKKNVFACGDNITFTYNGGSVTYGTVEGQDSTCWMDRNLGASQVATAYNDLDAYGDLFQWGRLDDGHQNRTSGTTSSTSSSDDPGHNNFITTNSGADYDWRDPQNDNLWQGASGTNNPCPEGWRIPTRTELINERLSWSSNDYDGAFDSPLKFTAAGSRDSLSGSVGSGIGWYWSSTTSTRDAYNLVIASSNAYSDDRVRAAGFSVRCIKDSSSPYIYIYQKNQYIFLSDFVGGATSKSKEYLDFKDITHTEIENGKVKLKITEELNETAYIDRIYLRVDGNEIIELSSITNANISLLRESDDQYLVMEMGAEHYLEFTAPEDHTKLEFAAEGYYIEHYNRGKSSSEESHNSLYTDYVELKVIINNVEPNITTPTFSPGTAYTDNDISCNATPTDAEYETLTVEYFWYNGTELMLSGNTSGLTNNSNAIISTLGSGNTTKGETWNCTVRSFDGTDYSEYKSSETTIQNSAPNITTPTFSPNTTDTTDAIDCNSTPTDADYETLTVEYFWYNGTELMLSGNTSGLTNNSNAIISTLGSGNTTKGETWNCTVRSFDGTDYSEYKSSETTIQNYVPNITTPTFSPATAYTNNNIDCNATPSDAENTTLTVEYFWYNSTGYVVFSGNKSGVSNGTNTVITTIGSGNTSDGEIWNCTVRTFDGHSYSDFKSNVVPIRTPGTYNFLGVYTFTDDYYSYQKSGSANFTGPDDTGDGEATDGNYSNIASSDGNYWVTANASADAEFDAQLYKFYIAENESNITDLTFKWEGYGETVTGYNTTLHAWDYDGSQWVQLDTFDFISSSDQNLTHSEITNPGNYIDMDGEVTLMAKTKKFVPDPCDACSCDGTSYDTLTCDGDTVYVDCNSDKCWSPTAGSTYNRGNAIDYCDNLNHSGKTDWYLPSQPVLENLCESSSCSGTCFGGDGSDGYYWSSTPYYAIRFSDCFDWSDNFYDYYSYYVRCYHSGSSPYLYTYQDIEYKFLSDFVGGATSKDKEFLDFKDITHTEIEDGKVKLKITEELNETAYIDRIYLRIDESETVELSSITDANISLLRESDDNYLVMEMGAEHYLEFTAPEDHTKLEFAAEGYYIEHYRKGKSSGSQSEPHNSLYTDYVELKVIINNVVPNITTPTFSPNTADTTDDIDCNATPTDAEYDTLTVEYFWYNGTELMLSGNTSGLTNNSNAIISTLGSGNTTKGETWNCTVRSFDGQLYSEYKSSETTIQNYVPNITTPTFSPNTADTTDDIDCNATSTDADYETLTVEYFWYNSTGDVVFSGNKSGVSNGTNTVITTIGSGNTSDGEIWNCTVRTFDGHSYSDFKSNVVPIRTPGIYNFLGVYTFTDDYYSYQKSGSANFTGPDDTGDGEATDGNYSNIAFSDGNYWVTANATLIGEYDSQIYKFYVTESKSQVSELNFTWEGYGETESDYNTTFYAWDYDGSQWIQFDTVDFTSSSDQNLTHSETSDPGKFIDTDGEVTLMAKTAKYEIPFCSVSADYNSTETIGGDVVYCDADGDMWTPTANVDGSATQYEWGGQGTDNPDDSCVGDGTGYPACNYCDTLDYAGHQDWQLPTCTDGDNLPDSCQLYQFGVENCGWDGGDGGQTSCTPAWDTNAASSYYWSSTERDSNGARAVCFNSGWVFYFDKINDFYVRCVRSGSSPYIYTYKNGEFTFLSDFVGGATSKNKEYLDFTDISQTEIENGKVKLKITEELNETAYIDRIYLRVDGSETVELSSITDANISLLNESDDNYLVMEMGAEHYLEFPAPENYTKIEFAAEGYYIEHYKKGKTSNRGSEPHNSLYTDYVELKVTENPAPNITTPTFSPTTADTADNIDCNATPTDAENTTLTVEWFWYNGTELMLSGNKTGVSNGTNTVISTLGSGNTTKGETWNCTVRAFDGVYYSAYESAEITIQNSPSTINLITPTNANTSIRQRTPEFTWSGNDDDGDTLNYTIWVSENSDLSSPNITAETQDQNYTPTTDLALDTQYFWRVQVSDGESYTNSSTWNFTTESYIEVKFINESISFGSMNLSETKNTTSDSPYPFLLENMGNVFVNITFGVTGAFWQSLLAPLNTSYLQFKADERTEANSFDYAGSQTTWMNLSTENKTLVKDLNYSDSNNEVVVDILIRVPEDEPAGSKSATFVIDIS